MEIVLSSLIKSTLETVVEQQAKAKMVNQNSKYSDEKLWSLVGVPPKSLQYYILGGLVPPNDYNW